MCVCVCVRKLLNVSQFECFVMDATVFLSVVNGLLGRTCSVLDVGYTFTVH